MVSATIIHNYESFVISGVICSALPKNFTIDARLKLELIVLCIMLMFRMKSRVKVHLLNFGLNLVHAQHNSLVG